LKENKCKQEDLYTWIIVMHHKMQLHLAYVLYLICEVNSMWGVSHNAVMGMDTLLIMLGTQSDGQHVGHHNTETPSNLYRKLKQHSMPKLCISTHNWIGLGNAATCYFWFLQGLAGDLIYTHTYW